MGSARQDLERREWLQREEELEQKQREHEDQEQYLIYLNSMRDSGLPPLSIEEWRKFVPDELKNQSAAVRAAAASANSTWNRLVTTTAEMVAKQALSDETLADLGFDPHDRVTNADLELSVAAIRATFEKWVPTESRYDFKTHYATLSDFLVRNRLYPSWDHVARSFNLLWNMCLLAPKPEPEPERVNLSIEPDPELERQKRLRDYEEKPVVRQAGRDYSQRDLDLLPADEYLRVMRVRRFHGVLAPPKLH